jgi:hypothetical protein
MTILRALFAALLLAVAVGAFVLLKPPAGPRSLRVFEADRLADLEVGMWQAYYRKENVRLFRGLLLTLHEQYRYSWAQAGITGFYLARAAARFATMSSNYDTVLPDLERAYQRIGEWTGSRFDPAAVARAELAWWVARRIPGQDSPENVGRLIADENAQLFDVSSEQVMLASVLRARAGRLRDEGGEHADWTKVSELLHQSYRDLHAAVNER